MYYDEDSPVPYDGAVEIPEEIQKIRDPLVFNLTRRELCFVSAGLLLAAMLLWLLFRVAGVKSAAPRKEGGAGWEKEAGREKQKTEIRLQNQAVKEETYAGKKEKITQNRWKTGCPQICYSWRLYPGTGYGSE